MQAFETGRTLPAKSLDFWFDYSCPYAYLASTQAVALAERMGVPLTYRPFLLGGVFRAVGTAQNLMNTLSPAKAVHNGNDMQRWAKRFGVTLKIPPTHPMRSVDALRATLAAGNDPKIIQAFYRIYWVDNLDISDRGVIMKVIASAGLDCAKVLEAMDSEAIKEELKKRTDEAIALGIFGAPAWVVDGKHLYWGQDRMGFVEGKPRDVAAPVSNGAKPKLDVYWDFSSPFAYLGSTQVAELAKRTGAQVTWRPMLLGGLFKSLGGPDVPMSLFSAAKQRYYAQDMNRWAEYWNVPFKFPSNFPMNSVRALRVYLALPESARDAYREKVFRAYWAEDQNIAKDDVLAACIGDEAVAKEAFANADSPEVKNSLRTATEHAASKGVFGAPTFVVDDRELFWGQDRIGLVEEALRGA